MKCRNCGAELATGAHFCRNCGAEVVGPRDVICKNCGAHNASGGKYCKSCGWPLQKEYNRYSNRQRTYPEPVVVKSSSNTGLIVFLSIIVGVLLIGALFIGTYKLAQNSVESSPQQIVFEREGNTESNYSSRDVDGGYDPNAYYEDTSSYVPVSSGTRYKYVIADVTWEEAFEDARSQGGRLAVLDTKEKFDRVTSELNELRANGSSGRNFFVGATNHGAQFQGWIDADGNNIKLLFDSINSYMGDWFWLPGEPSLVDKSTRLKEDYVEILYREDAGRWYGNDTINDPTSVFPELSGKMGYIIEFN